MPGPAPPCPVRAHPGAVPGAGSRMIPRPGRGPHRLHRPAAPAPLGATVNRRSRRVGHGWCRPAPRVVKATGQHEALLVRLASAIAEGPAGETLSSRLCHACCRLAGADGAAMTVSYTSADRVTLCATDEVAARLEDLQDVVGEGPGRTASHTGQIEVCALTETAQERWSLFAEAARDLVDTVGIHAVPMRPGEGVFGVLTFYQTRHRGLLLDEESLLRLAAACGGAVIRDPDALTDELSNGPWSSRALIHQATGMVTAQLDLATEDALAVLRAHAYAGDTTLAAIAAEVVRRRLRFTNPDERSPS